MGKTLRRFATAKLAKTWAQNESRTVGLIYVIESPDKEDPDHPFVVDTDGMLRNWEREVAVYEDGRTVRAGPQGKGE